MTHNGSMGSNSYGARWAVLMGIMGALLVACAPQRGGEVSPPVPEIRPTVTAVQETAPPIPSVTSTQATRNDEMTSSPLAPTGTSETVLTPTPAPFVFHGPIVLNIYPDFGARESALSLLQPPYEEVGLLLAEGGVYYGQILLSLTGKLLAYTRYETDSASVWILDMSTGERRQWGDPVSVSFIDRGGYLEPRNGISIQAWSPDEQALVVQEWHSETPLDEPVWSYLLSEEAVTPLGSRILDLNWSPTDPETLAYVSKEGGVYLAKMDEESPPALVSEYIEPVNGSISWHPDGRHVAVAIDLLSEGDSNLWIVDMTTGNRTFEDGGPPGEQFVRWAPNGQHLFWLSGSKAGILSFVEGTIDSVETRHFLPVPLHNAGQPWLPGSSYLGLMLPSRTVRDGIDLCFYSLRGLEVSCPLNAEQIVDEFQLDPSSVLMNAAWTP